MPGRSRLSWALSALLALALAGPALASDPELRGRFKGDERWMLSVILSDPDQKAAFDKQSEEAAKGDAAAKDAFEHRWRKRIVQFAGEYQRHLTTTDILPNAPTVEKMVNDWEFAITSHWLNHQTPEKQKEVMSDLSDGNAALGWFRGTVEKKIREKRKQAAAEMEAYVSSPEAARALAWVEPVQTARRQAEQASGAGRAAQEAGSPEEAARRAGEVFAGTPRRQDDATPPPAGSGEPVNVPEPPRRSGNLIGLTPPTVPAPGAGLRIAPPPAPLVNRDAEPAKKGSPMGVLVKKFAPAAGGILGAILGFVFGGPIGALIGAAVGAAAGFAAKKLVE